MLMSGQAVDHVQQRSEGWLSLSLLSFNQLCDWVIIHPYQCVTLLFLQTGFQPGCDLPSFQARSVFTLVFSQLKSPSKALNTGEKTGIDYIHTAASQHLQWLLLTFWKLCEARYKPLMVAPKDLCRDTREKQPAEL